MPPTHVILRTCSQVEIQVEGVPVQCLLDTGSQVTMLTESLFNCRFKDKVIQEGDLVDVEGCEWFEDTVCGLHHPGF